MLVAIVGVALARWVVFRRSDVISTGDLFTTTNYPIIDLDRGGSSDAAAFTVAAAATLLFTTGSFAMTGGNYDATGSTVVNSGTADFSAVPTADFDAGLTVSSGTMDLDTAGTSNDDLYYSGTLGNVYNVGSGLGTPDLARLARDFARQG